jgi:hypothetical protein
VTDDIKPRVDEDGVAWCDAGCPFKENTFCTFGNGGGKSMFTIQHNFHNGDVCPIAARRNAALLRECRMILGEPNGLLGSGFLTMEWRCDISALLGKMEVE